MSVCIANIIFIYHFSFSFVCNPCRNTITSIIVDLYDWLKAIGEMTSYFPFKKNERFATLFCLPPAIPEKSTFYSSELLKLFKIVPFISSSYSLISTLYSLLFFLSHLALYLPLTQLTYSHNLKMTTPTLINLPPPPSDPVTPSDMGP